MGAKVKTCRHLSRAIGHMVCVDQVRQQEHELLQRYKHHDSSISQRPVSNESVVGCSCFGST